MRISIHAPLSSKARRRGREEEVAAHGGGRLGSAEDRLESREERVESRKACVLR
jgi:hypothetical protein